MKKLDLCLVWVLSVCTKFCSATIKPHRLNGNNAKVLVWNKSEEEFVHVNRPHSTNATRKPFYCSVKNSIIQVLAYNLDPYIRSQHNSSSISGFLGDQWNILEEGLQFKSNITTIRAFSDGLSIIQTNQADVFLAALVYTEQTTDMLFSHPYFRNWYHLYFKLPKGKPSNFLHFEAFSGRLWLYVSMMFTLLTTTLWLTCIVLRKLVPKAEVLLSIPTYFMGVLSAFLNTGYDLKLRSCSARLQMIIALLFGVLCYYALSASLVASLAVLDRPIPFTNLEELAMQKSYSLCLRKGSFIYSSFTYPNETLLPKWRDIANTDNCPNMSNWTTIPDKICQENVVVLENRIIMTMALQNVHCQVTFLPQKYFGTGNYITFSKNFKERKAMLIMLLRMRSTGIARKLESKWVKNEVPNFSSTTEANQITYSHIQGLILIYLILIGVSLIILVLEIVFEKIRASFPVTKRTTLTTWVVH